MTSMLNTNGNGKRPELSDDEINELANVVGFTHDEADEAIEDIFAGEDLADYADDEAEAYTPDDDDIAAATVEALEAGHKQVDAIEDDDEEAYYQQQEQSSPLTNIGDGVDDENDEEEGEDATVNISSDYSDDEGDEDEDDLADPRSNKTKITLINSPFSQMALVAGGALTVFLVIGGVLTALTSTKTEQPVIAQSPTPETGIGENNATTGDSREYPKYKTEAAIGQQQELLKGLKPGQPQPKSSPVTKKPAPSPAPIAVAPPLDPVPMPVVAPVAPVAPVLPTVPPEKPSLEDSVRTWQLLSSVGSYGRVPTSGGTSSNSNSSRITTAPTTPTALFNTAPVTTPPVVASSTSSGGMSIQQLRASSSVPGMRDRPLVPVLVGTNAKGQLGTAIVLSGDNSSPIDPTNARSTKYLVQLTDGVKDADGGIAIPAGALMVAAVRTFSPSTGRAELQVIAVIVGNREYKLPEGSVIIRATDGGTLALKQQGGGGKFFQAVLPALLNGVAQAGQAINQPTSSSVVSGGSVTTSVTNGKNPNLAASFASGAANTLAQQLTQQVQVSNQAASQQQKAWVIGAGTAVQVFVNSTFEM